ncbi:MAG: hypothetical protein VB877_09290 [Pirellulaceae bacterium]
MAISTEVAALLLFLGAGLGMPPQPVDPVMEQAAPDECLVYLSWAEAAKPRAASINRLEKLLADEEIQGLAAEFWKQLDTGMARFAARDKTEEAKSLAKLVPEAARQLFRGEGAIYVADFKVVPGGLAIDAGIVLRTGNDDQPGKALNGPRLARLIEQFLTAITRAPPSEVKIEETVFHQVSLGGGIPPLTWGLHRGYLLLGVGNSAIANQLKRFKTPAPAWLTQVKRQLPVKRRSLLAYLDVPKTLEAVLTVAPASSDVAAVLEATGIGKMTHLAAVSGFDGPELATRWVLGINGKKTGFLAIPGDKVLERKSLRHIPADAAMALAVRVDVGQSVKALQETLQQIDPREAQRIERALEQFEKEMPGISIKRDLFPALGDLWTAHTTPDQGGFLTGWVFTVSVRDHALAQKVLQQLEAWVHRQEERDRQRGKPAALKKMMVGPNQVFCLVIPDDDTPLAPAWCLQKDRFILTLFPQAMRSYLKSSVAAKGLAEVPEVARLFKPERAPTLLQYTDTRELAKWLYPLSQVSFNALCAQLQRQGVKVNPGVFPTAGLIQQHLGPSVTAWYLQEDGLYTESRKSLPGVGPAMVWGQAMMYFSLQQMTVYRQFEGLDSEIEVEEKAIPR